MALDPVHFQRGDTIGLQVYATDGVSQSATLTADTVVVGNAPPVILSSAFNVDPMYTDALLMPDNDIVDRDGDPITLTYVEHTLCVDGERVLCDASGWSKTIPCPQGQSCVGDGQCVAGPAACEPENERCNLADDDCDGVIDESLPVVLGTPCPTNIAHCDAMGIWTCGPGEVPVCVTDPRLCPAWTTPDPGSSTPGGGVFTTPEEEAEPLEPVTTACSTGPAPGAPWALLALWLWARARRRQELKD